MFVLLNLTDYVGLLTDSLRAAATFSLPFLLRPREQTAPLVPPSDTPFLLLLVRAALLPHWRMRRAAWESHLFSPFHHFFSTSSGITWVTLSRVIHWQHCGINPVLSPNEIRREERPTRSRLIRPWGARSKRDFSLFSLRPSASVRAPSSNAPKS